MKPRDASQPSARARGFGRDSQPFAFGRIFDALRYADVGVERHQHEIAAGERDVRRQPRALGRDRIFRNLHQQRLALVHEVADVLLHRIRFGDADARRVDVARVQKSGTTQADVDERRLHARQDSFDASFIDVAGEAVGTGALQMHFGQRMVLDERDAGFEPADVDEQLFVHRRPHASRYCQVSTPKAWSNASVSASGRPDDSAVAALDALARIYPQYLGSHNPRLCRTALRSPNTLALLRA